MTREHDPHAYEKFRPDIYVRQYYEYLGTENLAILRFLTQEFQRWAPGGRMLDFGCGPTIYQFIAAAARVQEIHVADFLPRNLQAIQDWVAAKPGVFDWREYTSAVLAQEGLTPVDAHAIEAREAQIRKKLTRYLHCDLTADEPVAGVADGFYDILMSNYCLEQIAPHHDFEDRLARVFALLRPGGRLILQFTCGMLSYPVGDDDFATLPLDENDFLRILPRLGFAPASMVCQVVEAEAGLHRSYERFALMAASKA